MPNWISDRRLYTTADGSRVVEEGDPDGALLLVGEGCELPEATARKYGLIKDESQPDASPSGDLKPEGGQGEGEGKSPEGSEGNQPEGDQKPNAGEGDNPQTDGGKKPEGKAKPGNKK